MNEIERVMRYIKSTRDANIDCTITIDKRKSWEIYNALAKQVSRSVNIFDEEILTCPTCKNELDFLCSKELLIVHIVDKKSNLFIRNITFMEVISCYIDSKKVIR